MPSPFPGMDPWVEGPEYFSDFHTSLIVLLREAINAKMPPGYAARGTQLVWVDDEKHRVPDVGVFTPNERADFNGPLTLAGALAVHEEILSDPIEQSYLEIRDQGNKRLVTVVEILSPSNKRKGDKGRDAFIKKQLELRDAGVHLVEIDLLRAGSHTTAVPLSKLRAMTAPFQYHASITTCYSALRYYAIPIRLADPLPLIPIPLDANVDPVKVELQPLLDRAYDTGLYSRFMDYTKAPDPPLTPEQQTWADGILKSKGALK